MLADRDRLHRRAAAPRLVALARALGRLKSTLTVMNTGAHPDDEQNGMLAVLRHQMGMRVIVACSTRGEGGQNTLGPERLGALGLLRTREMEEAARVIDADIAWLGHGPEDKVHDFGFSKSGVDTLARWGRDRILERLVRAYRSYRPDIVIPTFLDVPGQHGHHRAMTEAAEAAIALAADPAAFPEHAAEGLLPWRVARYFLPAWSGGGDTYDDELPPPPITTWVRADDSDPISGASHDQLGEMSRAFHASQNMGHWRSPPVTEWELHLSGASGPTELTDGLPQSLADLAPLAELRAADQSLARAAAAFPNGPAIIEALDAARREITAALDQLSAETRAAHGHRLSRKIGEIDAALLLAAGFDLSIALTQPELAPGAEAELILDHRPGLATDISVQPLADQILTGSEPRQLTQPRHRLALQTRDDAPILNAFRPFWSSLGGNGPGAVRIEATVGASRVTAFFDPEEGLQLSPPQRVELDPEVLILPLDSTTSRRSALLGSNETAPPATVSSGVASAGAAAPAKAEPPDAPNPAAEPQLIICKATAPVHIGSAPGITLTPSPGGFHLMAAPTLAAGHYSLPVTAAGAPALLATPISYPHIGSTRHVRSVTLELLALDLILPGTRVALVDGGADRVGLWLRRMGVDLTLLDSAALEGDLSGFDTIVIGLFAYGTRPDLAQANERLKDWTRAGGHLVTLYHRPIDGWRGQETPPLRLSIGAPSLRWRVTDPAAPVVLLAPEHPLLAGPNQITAADFDGWDKERGLYFASSWDEAYVPLLSMSDAGEAPLLGSLLSAPVGAGRHSHCALVLHHQLDRLVPGAFRLMANLLQKA